MARATLEKWRSYTRNSQTDAPGPITRRVVTNEWRYHSAQSTLKRLSVAYATTRGVVRPKRLSVVRIAH